MIQTQAIFCVCFTNTNINFFSGAPKLPLIPKVSVLPKIKKSFLRLPVRNDKLLSTSKARKFQAKSSLRLQEPFPSNAVPYPLCTYFSL